MAGGLVWNAPTTNSNSSGDFTGRDPRMGVEKKQFSPDVPAGTYWFHHRCYIAKATEDFIIPSRTGIEYVDYRLAIVRRNLDGSVPAAGGRAADQ